MSYQGLRKTKHKSRKERRCDWCWEKVRVGDEYVADVHLYDREFRQTDFHPECEEKMADAAEGEWDFTYEPGSYERGTQYEKGAAWKWRQ